MRLDLNHLGGPGLVAWMREHGLFNLEVQLGSRASQVRHWQSGENPNVYAADEILTQLGLHLSEVPDELWIGREKGPSGRRLSDRERREIVERVKAGEPKKRVAREIGVAPSSVRHLVATRGELIA